MYLTETHIRLDDVRCYAYHGVLPQERVVGADYTVSLDLQLTAPAPAVRDDRLEGTVDYAEAFRLVRREMARPSALLEHVAGRILQALFDTFPRIEAASVAVRKVNPPMGADCSGAAVTLTARRFAPPRRLRLLILDFDGTLADTAAGIVATMTAAFRECGLPVPDAAAVRRTIGLPLPQSISLLAGLQPGEALDRATATYRRLFETIGTQAVSAFPHVIETLRRACGAGITTAIATSRGSASVRALCAQLGHAPYVRYYVAEDNVRHKKPAPDAVLLLLQQTGTRPEDCLVVGDTSYDIEMGRAAGCPTCGVTYGNHDRTQLAEADFLIDDFAQLAGEDGSFPLP